MLQWAFAEGYEYVSVFDCTKNKVVRIPDEFYAAAYIVGVVFGTYLENWAYVTHNIINNIVNDFINNIINKVLKGEFDDGDLLSEECYDRFPQFVAQNMRDMAKFDTFLKELPFASM